MPHQNPDPKLDPTLMHREARNVEELLLQMPMDDETVVVTSSHLAVRVYRDGGKLYLEHLGFMGVEPILLALELTEEQAFVVAAALVKKG